MYVDAQIKMVKINILHLHNCITKVALKATVNQAIVVDFLVKMSLSPHFLHGQRKVQCKFNLGTGVAMVICPVVKKPTMLCYKILVYINLVSSSSTVTEMSDVEYSYKHNNNKCSLFIINLKHCTMYLPMGSEFKKYIRSSKK